MGDDPHAVGSHRYRTSCFSLFSHSLKRIGRTVLDDHPKQPRNYTCRDLRTIQQGGLAAHGSASREKIVESGCG